MKRVPFWCPFSPNPLFSPAEVSFLSQPDVSPIYLNLGGEKLLTAACLPACLPARLTPHQTVCLSTRTHARTRRHTHARTHARARLVRWFYKTACYTSVSPMPYAMLMLCYAFSSLVGVPCVGSPVSTMPLAMRMLCYACSLLMYRCWLV